MIVGDDVELLGEGGNLVAPKRRKPAQPGDQQDRKAAAMPLVMNRAVADRMRAIDLPNECLRVGIIAGGTVKREQVCGRAKPGYALAKAPHSCLKFDTGPALQSGGETKGLR